MAIFWARVSCRLKVEVVDSLIFSQLIMNFEARLEKQLILLRFAVKRGHRSGERFSHLGNSVDIFMKISRIVVVCQLLKSQQNMICFIRRRGILSAELTLIGGAGFFSAFLKMYWGSST